MNEDDGAAMYSVEAPNSSTSDRGPIRRSNVPDFPGPKLSVYGCHTLYESLRRGAERATLHGPCLGFRARSTNPGGGSEAFTPYVYSTYGEVLTRIDNLSLGIDLENLSSRCEDPDLKVTIDCVGLYLHNCPEWTLVEHACYALDVATVPMYDTLGPETVTYILQHTSLKTVVCASSALQRLVDAKKELGPDSIFSTVVLIDGVTAKSTQLGKEHGLHVTSLLKLESIGARNFEPADPRGHHRPPSGISIATLCYTSGTTGVPKGALISHTNLISTLAMFLDQGGEEMAVYPGDRHLSYLPLPHIFERITLNNVLAGGGSVAYLSGTTDTLVQDWVACRPTVLAVVPRVLNKIHDKIKAGMEMKGGAALKMFRAALRTKTHNMMEHGEMSHFLWDKIIFNKIKKGLGMDCVKLMVSGSAPLSPAVMNFFRVVLGTPVIEGYGQTEGSAGATLSMLSDVKTAGHVGPPLSGVELVLEDVPEMGYVHTDTDHNGEPCKGRGEICIRGPNVFVGYFKQPKATRETVDKKGWLHSGDIGIITPDGNLKIVDRKKNIFKLAQGEYVAAEKIENCLLQSPLIAQCFVYGDSFQNFLVACVVPDEEVVNQWAQGRNRPPAAFRSLCADSALKEAVMEDVRAISAKEGLQGFETVRNVFLTPEPFTAENGLVTPTFKLKRQQLREHFQKEIERMYSVAPLPRSKL